MYFPCGGTCLKKEARFVFVDNTTLPQISDFSIGHAMDFFNNLKFSGQRAKIAEKVLKEIQDRLKFLVNVGLELFDSPAQQKLCPAARHSVSVLPARSAPALVG